MQVQEFVEFVKSECARLGVIFEMSENASVLLQGTHLQVNGYFCDEPKPILAIATGKPEEKWFPTLVHEYCHMLQWSEKDPVWDAMQVGEVGTSDLVDLWLEGHIELITQAQLDAVFHPTMEVEWNCERRVLDLIAKLQLPIDAKKYAQGANAYVLFYHLIQLRRRWYELGREPYALPDVWSKMPDTLVADFRVITPELLRALEPCFATSEAA